MNDEMREMLEEVSELKHKVDKIERKLQQKIGMRSGYSRGGYQRMGQNSGNWNSGGQSMGESGGVERDAAVGNVYGHPQTPRACGF